MFAPALGIYQKLPMEDMEDMDEGTAEQPEVRAAVLGNEMQSERFRCLLHDAKQYFVCHSLVSIVGHVDKYHDRKPFLSWPPFRSGWADFAAIPRQIPYFVDRTHIAPGPYLRV